MSNVLLQAERRGRISAGDVARRLELIAGLPVEIDPQTAGRASREILVTARATGLSAYDAAYLELAMRRGLPLLTKDGELASAARRLAVTVLP